MKTFLALLFFSAVSLAQMVPDRYVVELSDAPAAVRGPRSGMAARRMIVQRAQTPARNAVANLGGTVLDSMDTVLNALIVNIPDVEASRLSRIDGVLRVYPVRRIRPYLNHALPLHKVPDAWNMLPQGQTGAGAGIKIGVIDTGIDVTHPAFSDSLPALDGFPKVLASTDQKFTNSKIVVAKNFTSLLEDGGDPDADDYIGHGTGTSMAAAGGVTSSPYGAMSGVAPKAYLGNYKVLSANGGSSDVIAKAIDEAVADGMDVLNISLGSFVAFYSDVTPDEIGIAAIENATKAGVVVITAAGNSGPAAGTIGDYASAPDAIAAGAIRNDRTLADAVIIDGIAPYQAFPGDGTIPDHALAAPLVDAAVLGNDGLACSALPPNSATGAIVLIQRGTCTFETKLNNAAASGAIAALIYNSATGSTFTWGSATVGLATLAALFTNLDEGTDIKARIAGTPGLEGTLEFQAATLFAARPDLSSFSSRGPSIGSALKPDLVAVGEQIVTATETSHSDGEIYDPSGFLDLAGTSYSAPRSAGAAAVLKAARPGLSMAQYRSLLINSASPATSGPDTAATVAEAGAGVLNLAAAMTGTLAAYPTSLNFGTGAGTIDSNITLWLTNVGASSETYNIAVAPSAGGPVPVLSASTVQLDPGATQHVQAAVNASNLAPGAYQGSINITGTVNPVTATIPYWFGVPGPDPGGIAVLYSDPSDPARSSILFAAIFRVTDITGSPYTGSVIPTATVTAGTGSIRSVYPVGDIPGTYAVDVRTGTTSMQITLAAGSATSIVVIPVY